MGNYITNTEIILYDADEQLKEKVQNNKITFTGEEIRNKFIITVETDVYYKKKWSFNPEKHIDKPYVSMPFEYNNEKQKKPIIIDSSQNDYELKNNIKKKNVEKNVTYNNTKSNFLREKWIIIVPSVAFGFIIGFFVAFLLFNNQKINETIFNQTLNNIEELENVNSSSEAEIVIENQEATTQSNINPQTTQTQPSTAQIQRNPLID